MEHEDLRSQFNAEEGSFLLQLRCDFAWDKDAFRSLIKAMEGCAESNAAAPFLDRHIAEGFWHCSWFVRQWTTHPNFPKPHGEEYYQRAFDRLHDLAFWYFLGKKPWIGAVPEFD